MRAMGESKKDNNRFPSPLTGINKTLGCEDFKIIGPTFFLAA